MAISQLEGIEMTKKILRATTANLGVAAMVALLLAGLAIAPTAVADDAEEVPPPLQTSVVAHLPLVESLEPVARAYWAQRQITLPEPVEVFLIPNSSQGAAWGEQPGHRVWLTESLMIHGFVNRVVLCMIYLHERGHNAGLAHGSGDPIMDENESGPIPPKCLRWAKTHQK